MAKSGIRVSTRMMNSIDKGIKYMKTETIT